MEPEPNELDALEQLARRRRSSLFCEPEREVPASLLERLCGLVFTAPNHKHTAPWQLAVFVGAARRELGEVLSADLAAGVPGVAEAKVGKTRSKYMRAPAIVVAGCRPDPDPRRHREDTFAVAAGVENLLLGAAAAGLAALWSSPPVIVAPRFNEHAGFAPGTELLAVVYLGWPSAPAPAPPRPEPVVHWFAD